MPGEECRERSSVSTGMDCFTREGQLGGCWGRGAIAYWLGEEESGFFECFSYGCHSWIGGGAVLRRVVVPSWECLERGCVVFGLLIPELVERLFEDIVFEEYQREQYRVIPVMKLNERE
jgi:hypothetical protein